MSEKRIGGAIPTRRAVTVSPEALVREELLAPGRELPVVLEPAVPGVDLAAWAAHHRDRIQRLVLRHGGILFRNFCAGEIAAFEQVSRALSPELLEYRERSSPRSQVGGRIYTSTDYPADQEIFLHNENSYQHVWPQKIFFFCVPAPMAGGETPLADCRKVYQRIDP